VSPQLKPRVLLFTFYMNIEEADIGGIYSQTGCVRGSQRMHQIFANVIKFAVWISYLSIKYGFSCNASTDVE